MLPDFYVQTSIFCINNYVHVNIKFWKWWFFFWSGSLDFTLFFRNIEKCWRLLIAFRMRIWMARKHGVVCSNLSRDRTRYLKTAHSNYTQHKVADISEICQNSKLFVGTWWCRNMNERFKRKKSNKLIFIIVITGKT